MTATGRKILIAMDGSTHSDYAFDWYMKYFYKDRDDVLIVYCSGHVPLHTPANFKEAALHARMAKDEEWDTANVVGQLQKKIQTAGIKGNVIRLAGTKPGEVIVQASEEHKVDMIITGTRGPTKTKRTLFGSVSQYIVYHAHIPVLVVRQ